MSLKETEKESLARFDVMAAMCHGNRGIGMNGSLPWPSLPHDFAYYTKKTGTFQNQDSEKQGKFIIHIFGRKTWTGNNHRDVPNVRYVIISNNMTPDHPSIMNIVPSFEAALRYTSDLSNHGNVDSIWIMGGSRVYEAALAHPQCRRLYLTHVYQDFPSDTVFPEFEDHYMEVKNGLPDVTNCEDNGVRFEFKAYERMQV